MSGMAVNYEYYKVFYYVAKYKSMTQAAAALLNNQPNVTRMMKQLENELGCKLLIRSNKGITLTEEGGHLFERVSVAYEQLRMGEEELLSHKGRAGGTLSLGATETALHLLLFEQLGHFRHRFPDVRLKIHNYTTKQAIAAVRNGQIECAVITSPVQVKPPLQALHICNFRDRLFGGSEFAHLSEKEHTWKMLLEYPFICLEKNTNTYDFYNYLFLDKGLVLEPDMEVATADLMLPMIEHNLGIGFLTHELAQCSVEEKKVWEIPLKEPVPERGVYFLYDRKRSLGKAAVCLKEMLLQSSKDGKSLKKR